MVRSCPTVYAALAAFGKAYADNGDERAERLWFCASFDRQQSAASFLLKGTRCRRRSLKRSGRDCRLSEKNRVMSSRKCIESPLHRPAGQASGAAQKGPEGGVLLPFTVEFYQA